MHSIVLWLSFWPGFAVQQEISKLEADIALDRANTVNPNKTPRIQKKEALLRKLKKLHH